MRILQAIQAEPGIHKSELCRRTGLGWGTVGFHIHKLCAARKISALRANGRLILLPMDAPADATLAIKALRHAPARMILEQLTRERLGMMDLSKEFGLSRKVMRRHLNSLADLGLIRREPGHRGQFDATVKGRMTLRSEAHESALIELDSYS